MKKTVSGTISAKAKDISSFFVKTFSKDIKKLDKAVTFTPNNDWDLVFFDDFNTLDFTKWKTFFPENGIRRTAYYTADEDVLFVENSNLIIRTKWKNGKYGEGFYTSWLESSVDIHKETAEKGYKGFSDTFGYYEIRCKFPPAYGIWSAFWLMPDNENTFSENDIQNTGEDGAEIDIYESPFYYSFKDATQSAVHCDGYDDRLKSASSKIYEISDPYNNFHTYGVLWKEDEYVFYIDGRETWRTNHLNGTAKVNEYMILSVEVGGENDGKSPTDYKYWCGNALKNSKDKNYDFIVDWIKVYKKNI